MKRAGSFVFFLFAVAVFTPARAGHEPPIYPSYYPQEIRIEAMTPEAAASRMRESKVHAYVGAPPAFAEPEPKTVRHVDSLGSYVVARVNPDSPRAKDGGADCAAITAVVAALAGDAHGFVFHPYPVTPFHADYLHHADRTEAIRERVANDARNVAGLSVVVRGSLADKLTPGLWPGIALATVPDVIIEDISVASLLAPHRTVFNGWLGPPWLKEGWFHAYLLLAPALGNGLARDQAETLIRRLIAGAGLGAVERINTERDLVGTLAAGCRTVVTGYTVKQEYYSAEYSEGIENVAHDSHDGLNAPIFLRTVKLKDFPWNGWLRLGVSAPPAAAWNPIGGFDDDTGRLIWSAIGDPAMIPEPYGAGWIFNRIGDVNAGVGR